MKKNLGLEKITHFIDEIEVVYKDDGKTGFIAARGYTYFPQDNSVVTFEAKYTCSLMKHIVKELNDYVVVGSGKFILTDKRKPLKMETEIRNAFDCAVIYKELEELKKLKVENNKTTYNKIIDIFEDFV